MPRRRPHSSRVEGRVRGRSSCWEARSTTGCPAGPRRSRGAERSSSAFRPRNGPGSRRSCSPSAARTSSWTPSTPSFSCNPGRARPSSCACSSANTASCVAASAEPGTPSQAHPRPCGGCRTLPGSLRISLVCARPWPAQPVRSTLELTPRGDAMSIRPVKRIIEAVPTLEGAGVKLRRAFGFGETAETDPFLLFDDFRNERPADYIAGFPWHPHRGIETITYVLAGTVFHGDSLGNSGQLGAGDIQWMTAGRGILHQEMPKGDPEGRMHGFQLWANLPSSLKMTAPRYQEIKTGEIPEVVEDDGSRARIVCGEFWGKRGPVVGIAADPVYIDVSVPAGKRKTLPVETTRHALAYVFAGSGKFCNASAPLAVPTEGVGWADTSLPTAAENRSLILFDS